MEQREIKFRAWADGRMHANEAIMMRDGRFIIGVWDCEETTIVEEYHGAVFMQCTGLEDKNGKEIYEGDIICDDDNGEDRELRKIVFSHCHFSADLINRGRLPRETSYYLWLIAFEGTIPDCQVIGNIYQNPELLEANNG